MIMIAVGVVAIVMGFMTDKTRTWAALLQNDFYFTAMALAGTFFVAFQYVAQAGWAVGIKRVPEAMGGFLKFGMAGMIVIFLLGHHDLYHWTHAELYDKASPEYDHILAGKQGFLNIPFFVIRLVAYAAIWIGFTMMLRKHSLLEDKEGGLEHYKRSITLSAIFIVLFAVTSSTSAWDFLMSIDAHWFSTLFGWYTFAGLFVSGLAMMAMFILYLRGRGYMNHITENHLHDVGKFMFAFSVFWTYLWFSQFMLIWYANIPEETTYFKPRAQGPYSGIFWLMFIINFIAPLLILMRRGSKRNYATVTFMAMLIIFGHWLDFYQMVFPGPMTDPKTGQTQVPMILWDFGVALGFVGVIMFVTGKALSKAPLLAKNHPFVKESLIHHT